MTHDAVHRLRHDVERLALSDGRAVGTPGHARAQGHLVARLGALDLEPYGDAFALPYAAGGQRFANLVEALVRGAAERDLKGPWEGYDTTATDVATTNAALGPLLAHYGLEVRDRAGIERVVRLLAGQMGL